jgi:3-phenylpropionate/trans-cinnamate dioxygenase ferredoxin component
MGGRSGRPRPQVGVAELDVCPVEELPSCSVKIVYAGEIAVGVYNLNGEYYALEDRCSHDDGPLAEGEFDAAACTVECPRHGSLFDLRSGRPKTLPAFLPVETFEARIENGEVMLEH